MEEVTRGAEAVIYLEGDKIFKERLPKRYRVKELDDTLRKARTRKEAKLLSLARRAGVPTPLVYHVDTRKGSIEMEHVEGTQMKNVLNSCPEKERKNLCMEIGKDIGKLHETNIIHGDLTTSNMMLRGDRVFFIDFGLGEVEESVEAKGVDILVFKRALHSTHYGIEKECFEAAMNGYSEEFPGHEKVMERLKIIERRGRYFSERGA